MLLEKISNLLARINRPKAYCAHGMTGRPGIEVVAESDQALKILNDFGIEVLDPVTAEKVKPGKKKINTDYETLDGYWRRDKEMIREAHVLIDLTPDRKSEGVSHEIGYARYHLWKKVIRVYPKGQVPSNLSVAYFEDDFITDSLEEAAKEIIRTHGTRFKRLKWRLQIYRKSILRAIWHRLQEWK